jgi:hypothetical protein
MSDGQTATGSRPNGSTVPSGGTIGLAEEVCSLTKDQSDPTAAPSSQHAEAGGQTASPSGPTASSCSLTIRPPAPAGPIANSYLPTVRLLAPIHRRLDR